MTRSKQPLAALLAALLFAVTSSCSNDDNDDAADPTPSPESDVEAAYLAYWEMLVRLSAAPDENDLAISQRSTGQAEDEVKQGLTRLRTDGLAARTGPAYRHEVISVEVRADEAQVRDCSVDDSVVIAVATGDEVGGGTTATGLIEAGLRRVDGAWKVERVDTVESWTGERSCDED